MGEPLEVARHLADQAFGIDRREGVVAELAGFGRMQLLDLPAHVRDVLEQLAAAHLIETQLDLGADQRQRRLELVRGGGQKILLQAVVVLEPIERGVEILHQRPHFARHPSTCRRASRLRGEIRAASADAWLSGFRITRRSEPTTRKYTSSAARQKIRKDLEKRGSPM